MLLSIPSKTKNHILPLPPANIDSVRCRHERYNTNGGGKTAVISKSRNILYILLVVSLGIAGLLLLFTGWWLPETSTPLQIITGLSWLALSVATYFIRTKPSLQLAAAWLWFACSAWNWWKTTDQRSVIWFLIQNALAILILAFSHLVVLNIARSSRSST
jgi:hypothetical protein